MNSCNDNPGGNAADLRAVIPAKAGIQCRTAATGGSITLDSRLRGNDGLEICDGSKNPRSRTLSTEAGFAYIWTLLLVAFMGIGSSIASELYSTSVRRDKERELLFIGHEFRAAIARYHGSAAAGPQMYPLTLQDLVKDPRFPNARRHLRRLYADPLTGKADWGLIRVEGRIVGVHSLSQRAPIKVDNFDDHDSGFRSKGRYADWTFVYPHDMFVPPQEGEEGKNGAPLQIGVLPKAGAPR